MSFAVVLTFDSCVTSSVTLAVICGDVGCDVSGVATAGEDSDNDDGGDGDDDDDGGDGDDDDDGNDGCDGCDVSGVATAAEDSDNDDGGDDDDDDDDDDNDDDDDDDESVLVSISVNSSFKVIILELSESESWSLTVNFAMSSAVLISAAGGACSSSFMRTVFGKVSPNIAPSQTPRFLAL